MLHSSPHLCWADLRHFRRHIEGVVQGELSKFRLLAARGAVLANVLLTTARRTHSSFHVSEAIIERLQVPLSRPAFSSTHQILTVCPKSTT